MPLLKALQKQELPPEHYEFLEASLVHKAASKRFARVPADFKNSTNPLERLQYADENRRYSEECKSYHAIRRRWIAAKARMRLGTDINPEALAELVQLEIPASMKDILEDARKQGIANSVSNEEFEAIKKAALENQLQKEQQRENAKEQFMKQTVHDDKYDPTFNDDTPLP